MLSATIGGDPLYENDFHALRQCMSETRDKEFVMISNFKAPVITKHPHLRFKFPVDITWNELNNEGARCAGTSYRLMKGLGKDFFIFGDSGLWGKYAACEYLDRSVDPAGTPLDIIGFKPKLTSIFKQFFCFDEQMFFYDTDLSEEEREEHREWLLRWLPLIYKKRMGIPIDAHAVPLKFPPPNVVIAAQTAIQELLIEQK